MKQHEDKTVILRFMDSDNEPFFTSTWSIELPKGMAGAEIVKVKNWTDEHIELGRTARVWLKRTNPGEYPAEYLLTISGKGWDGRWAWLNAFVSALKTYLERNGYNLKKIGHHDFE